MKKILPAIIILAFLAGCGPSKNKLSLKLDSAKTANSAAKPNPFAADESYTKLSCDSLMKMLIKTSSVNKTYLNGRMAIDSIKNKVIYLSFANTGRVEADMGKKELRDAKATPVQLTFNKQLLDYLVQRNCYQDDEGDVNPPH